MKKTNRELFFEEEFGVILRLRREKYHNIVDITNKTKFYNLILLLIQKEEGYNKTFHGRLNDGYTDQEAFADIIRCYINAIESEITEFIVDIHRPYITILLRNKKLKWILKN